MNIIINFIRPGKGVTQYTEGLVDEHPARLKTCSYLSTESSLKWCADNWWQNGLIPHGMLVGSVIKYLFFHEWFSIMHLIGTQGEHLGTYVDIITPMQKVAGEWYLTDLFLDLWISLDGQVIELDRDEFEEAYRLQLISSDEYHNANRVIELLNLKITSGEFPSYLD